MQRAMRTVLEWPQSHAISKTINMLTNKSEPQQKCRLGTVSKKLLGGLNRFYRRLTSPSASIMAQNIQLFGPRGGFQTLLFLYPATQKVAGYYVIPSENFEILSVCPSVSASFPDCNFSSFWPIFFKLCMDIDIGEEWFGIANGLNSFINNRVMALDWCKNVVSGL